MGLVIQHAKRMRHTVLSCCLSFSAIFSPTLSHKQRDFRKNAIEHKMYVHFLYNFVRDIFHSKHNSTRYNKLT